MHGAKVKKAVFINTLISRESRDTEIDFSGIPTAFFLYK
jgi:hypothetical protein